MNAKFPTRCTAVAAIVFILSTGGTAFADEMAAGVTVLRGTPAPREPQQQTPQTIQVAPPPLPTCPEGYAYSLWGGYCYRLKNPLGDDW